jgi:putative membrane protein
LRRSEQYSLLAVALALLVVSGVAPYDRRTWWLEIFPILLAAPLLIATAPQLPLTAFMALIGAVAAFLLARVHDRQLARLATGSSRAT